MKITHRIDGIELNRKEDDEDDKPGGYCDVVTHLRDENPSRVLGFTTTRVFFTDENITLDRIRAEAPRRALSLLSQILELSEVPANPEGLE